MWYKIALSCVQFFALLWSDRLVHCGQTDWLFLFFAVVGLLHIIIIIIIIIVMSFLALINIQYLCIYVNSACMFIDLT